ncbi:MAG TPA: RNA polymerase sigma factor [Polyangiaceae bacterium]|nr:RNA polymerase sigma factor [Polyangiaceae bacterium]
MQVNVQVLAAARAGDPSAMQTLLTSVRPDVRRCAVYYCGRASAVDEVVQETLLVVSRRLASLNNLGAFTAWIFTIVARVCLWPALKLARGIEHLAEPRSAAEVPQRPIEELRLDIAHALESLPLEYREVLLMRDFEGLSIGEMAQRLHITPAATKSRLHRARALAREYLVDGGST